MSFAGLPFHPHAEEADPYHWGGWGEIKTYYNQLGNLALLQPTGPYDNQEPGPYYNQTLHLLHIASK